MNANSFLAMLATDIAILATILALGFCWWVVLP